MENGHNDNNLGIPPQEPHTGDRPSVNDEDSEETRKAASERSSAAEPEQGAEDSPGQLGVPPQKDDFSGPLSREELENIQTEKESKEKRRAEKTFETEIEKRLPQLPIPKFLSHPLIICVLVIGISLLALFALSQTASLLSSVNRLPAWEKWVLRGALVLLLGTVVFAFGKLVFAYFRLSRNEQIPLTALTELSQRETLQKLVDQKRSEAQKQLQDYLRAYPMEQNTEKVFSDWTVSKEKLEKLNSDYNLVANSSPRISTDEWFDLYEKHFQKRIDEIAEIRIKRWARRAWMRTSVLPYPLADTLVVAYCSYEMLSDLCIVYNVRMGAWNTTVVLGYVVWNTLIAGTTDKLEGQMEDAFDWATENLPAGALKDGVRDIPGLGKIIAKLGSGGLNGLLLRRLGRKCQQLLRPVNTS
ncbi:MAG: DUF697 domain-containing protein [Candidatus Brocadiia bacterium]